MCKLNSGSLTSISQALLVHILGSKKKPGSFLDTTTISLHFFFSAEKSFETSVLPVSLFLSPSLAQ